MTRNTRYSLSMLPALVALFLVITLPYLERLLFPVVKDFVVVGMVKEPQAVTINGYMRKVRDCKFIGVQAVAVDSSGHEHDAPLCKCPMPTLSDCRPLTDATLFTPMTPSWQTFH